MLIAKNKKEIHLLPAMANRHGLISGSTGSGKSISVLKIAEEFSKVGVPVFLADIKNELNGIEFPGNGNSKILERVQKLGMQNFTFEGNPVQHWDVFGKTGRSMKTTIDKMGILLISQLLDLSDAQLGSLYQLFFVAKDYNIKLRDLEDVFLMAGTIMNAPENFEQKYGRIASISFASLQRSILMLKENSTEDVLFTKKKDVFDIDQLFTYDVKGNGTINVLNATRLIHTPKVYAMFLLSLLSDLYMTLPETGDLNKPKICFIFDESHLLFRGAPKALLDMIEKIVRLIRSKGVSVFFATQNPMDIPDKILGQLGNRVQHGMRAFTPKEQKIVKTISQTFRTNTELNTEQAIYELKIGEALISFLQSDGSPSIVERAWIVPPQSRIGSTIQDDTHNSIRNINFYPFKEMKSDNSEIEFFEKTTQKETNIFCKEELPAMDESGKKDKAAVLLYIPKKTYDQYLKILSRRGLKRQAFNAKLFLRAVELEIAENQ